jgi:hypothetical protein
VTAIRQRSGHMFSEEALPVAALGRGDGVARPDILGPCGPVGERPCRMALHGPYVSRHARRVRHATQEDLDRLEALLAELRKLPQLRERKRGYFSRGSRAFLHFHADAGDLYVDVKLGGKFERMRVTSHNEQADFLSRVGTGHLGAGG